MLSLRRIRIVATPLLLTALLVCGMCGCGHRTARKATKPNLDAVQCVSLSDSLRVDTLDFGVVKAGEVVERTFALLNESSSPVLIVTTDTSCGCLELDYAREPIAAGAKVAATMRFFSSGYNYFPPRAFYIVSSASLGPKKLVVTATME